MSDYQEQLKDICDIAADTATKTAGQIAQIIKTRTQDKTHPGFFQPYQSNNEQLIRLESACSVAGENFQKLSGQLVAGVEHTLTTPGLGSISTPEKN